MRHFFLGLDTYSLALLALRSVLLTLSRTPRLRAITLGTCYNYLAVGMVYFGLSFSGEFLSSDPYLYMVLTGLVEVPAYTFMIPFVTSYGRRSTIIVFFLLSGVMLLFLPFIPEGLCSLDALPQ